MNRLFTTRQLALIAQCADECAQPHQDGEPEFTTCEEMAVFDMIATLPVSIVAPETDWTAERLRVLRSCAERCARRRSGAVAVYRMVAALKGGTTR